MQKVLPYTTILKYYDCVWMLPQQASLNCHLEEFIEVHSIIRRQGLQQMDLQMGCGPSPSFLGKGFHMEIDTWQFFHVDVMLPEKSDKISQIC